MNRPIFFVCPETKLNVQHWLGNGEDVREDAQNMRGDW